MLRATKGFTIVKKVQENGLLKEVESDRLIMGEVVDSELYNQGTVIYFIPHSQLPINTLKGMFYAIPDADIVAVLIEG